MSVWRRGVGRGRGRGSGNNNHNKNNVMLSVSRSGGFGDEGDSLKSFKLQEKYWNQISTKLDSLLLTFNNKSNSKTEDQQNVLINLRKLREGISASHRNDSFSRSVYSISLYVSILFQSERDADPCISLILDPAWTNGGHDALFIALLYTIVHAGASHFLSSIKTLPNARSHLGDSKFTWLRNLASSLNTGNYMRLHSLIKSHPPTFLESRLDSLSLSPSSFHFSNLPDSATEYLLATLSRTYPTTTAWPILRSAYRELHLQQGSETRAWLSACLLLTSDESLDKWMSEKEELGQIKRKEALDGRWIVPKV